MRRMTAFNPIWLLATLAAGLGACAEAARERQPAAGGEATRPAPAAAATVARPSPSELLPNGAEPFPGVLTGGQPTIEGLEAARELGYSTVINLRAPEEGGPGAAEVEALGMRYVSIPVRGAGGVTVDNARALADALAAAEGGAVVHCRSGNRVGALFALKAFHVDGKTAEEALAAGKAAGLTKLEPLVRQELGLPAHD